MGIEISYSSHIHAVRSTALLLNVSKLQETAQASHVFLLRPDNRLHCCLFHFPS